MKIYRPLLAYVHMERTGGTTLNSILRRNFLPWHLDVRPLSRQSEGTFRPHDLVRILRINPGLQCISGHSVTSWAALEDVAPNIHYITILRDPVKRYASHYIYWVERKRLRMSFREFASIETLHNLQTKKIAGRPDLELAKEIIRTRFLALGVLEEFDEFIVTLIARLRPVPFDGRYIRQNATRNVSAMNTLLAEHQDTIRKHNAIDVALYEWAVNVVLVNQKDEYGPTFAADLGQFVEVRKASAPAMWKSYVDYACRKLYFEPCIGARRLLGGLHYHGAY